MKISFLGCLLLSTATGCSNNSTTNAESFLNKTNGQGFMNEEQRMYEETTTTTVQQPRRHRLQVFNLLNQSVPARSYNKNYRYGNKNALGTWWSSHMGESGNSYTNGRKPFTPGDYIRH